MAAGTDTEDGVIGPCRLVNLINVSQLTRWSILSPFLFVFISATPRKVALTRSSLAISFLLASDLRSAPEIPAIPHPHLVISAASFAPEIPAYSVCTTFTTLWVFL